MSSAGSSVGVLCLPVEAPVLSQDATVTEAGGRGSAYVAGDRAGLAEVHEGECIKRRE